MPKTVLCKPYEKDVTNNRKYWHTAKSIFYRKINSREGIILIEKNKVSSKEDQVANALKDFFSNIVKNGNIPEHHVNALHHRLSNYPTLKAILKYKNHFSIDTIRCATKHLSSFISQVGKKTVKKKLKCLEINKAVQDVVMPVKILKKNAEFSAEQKCCQFKGAISSPISSATFKWTNITLVLKFGSRN